MLKLSLKGILCQLVKNKKNEGIQWALSVIIVKLTQYSFPILILFFLAGCTNQQLQLGANAFSQGKYDVAASHWNPLAKNGNLYAQYNLGLLWEDGLGSTPKNMDEASHWYLKSAQQGFVLAMVRLANIQKISGYEEAAHSWYVLAARWGNQDAIAALSAWRKMIPPADLLQQKQSRDAIAQQQAAEALGRAAYSLGCALGGSSCLGGYSQSSLPSYTERYKNSAPTSVYSEKECSSDFSCGIGYKCVKAPLKNRGVCMRSVDEYGLRQYSGPNTNSVGPNLNLDGQCQFDTDCPIGFKCDLSYKACVKR